MTWHDMTWHYITLHTYIYIYTTYIYIYIYTVYIYICVCVCDHTYWNVTIVRFYEFGHFSTRQHLQRPHFAQGVQQLAPHPHLPPCPSSLKASSLGCVLFPEDAKWKRHGQYQMSITANSMIMIMIMIMIMMMMMMMTMTMTRMMMMMIMMMMMMMMMMMINPLFPLPSVRIL